MLFSQKIKALKEIVPMKFRIGSGVGSYNTTGTGASAKKVYENYSIMAYIDSRDCMDRLDEIFGCDRQKEYHDVGGKAYCTVSLWDGKKWIARSDVGDPTAIAKNKGEASDSFKRACVCRGLGRFLYTMPKMFLSKKEIDADKYNLKSVVMKKFGQALREWNADRMDKLDMLKSKYSEGEDEDSEDVEITPSIDEVAEGFGKR